MNLGAHMSIAGGVHKALERAESINCNVVQIFTKNQTRWSSPPLKEVNIEYFHQLKPRFFSVLAHASYLINLSSPDKELYQKSVSSLADEILRCHLLGLKLLVLHPGFHRGDGVNLGIRRAAQGIQEACDLSGSGDVAIILETTSGQGTAIGSRFEHLRDILAELNRRDLKSGVCLDTCHIFSAGYDIRDSKSYRQTWQAFEGKIGFSSLQAVHLNDSKKEFGSRIDRHEHIGQGKIGLDGFKLIMKDPHLESIPMALETPKGTDFKEDIKNLSVLRSLRPSREAKR